jgi:predicted dinucleotide-binding enzyme
MMGSRTPQSARAAAFTAATGARFGTHAEAAAHGEWIVNALPGESAIEVLRQCEIGGKILIDIANYDHAVDGPIQRSLGETIQETFPTVRLVKTLNCVSAHLMVDPAHLAGPHNVFIASNDDDARQQVTALLRDFGWETILDLGDLTACRATEQLIPLWMRLYARFASANFNLAVIRAD